MTSYIRKCRKCNEEIVVVTGMDVVKCNQCGEFHIVDWMPKLVKRR